MLKPVWRSFLLLRRRQKIIFLLVLGARVAVHALDLMGLAAIGMLGAMLAGGLTNQTDAQFLGFSVAVDERQNFLWVSAIVAGFFLAKSATATILLRVSTLFLGRVEAAAASELATFIFSGDISRIRSMSKGEIQWAVSESSRIAFSAVLFSGSALVAESALFVAVVLAFLFVDVSMTFFILAYFSALVVLFQLAVNKRLRRLGVRLAENAVRVNNTILDIATTFRELSVLEKRDVFLERFGVARRREALDMALQRFVFGVPRYFIEAALMVGIVGLIFWQFTRGTVAEGLVITGIFLAGGTRMMAALLPLQNAMSELRIKGPQAARAQDLIAEARDALNSTFKPAGERIPLDLLEVERGLTATTEGLTHRYPDAENPALSDVSITIPSGALVAFIGPSGAGKTTLADLLLGIHTPSSGKVLLGGESPKDLRKAHPGLISYVPQKPGMVSGTIAENVALGVSLDEIDWDRVNQVLGQAGMAELIEDLPLGPMTNLGEQTDALSGGQLQRLGIARALYTRPRLLVLDEATSALDAKTEADISDEVRALRGRVTVIVIAHRLSTIQNADNIFVLEKGRVTAEGTLSELRTKVPLIERYVQLLNISDGDDSLGTNG